MPLPKPIELTKNEVTSGQTIAAKSQYVSCIRPNSRAGVVQLTGTWSGTIAFYYSLNDITWIPCPMVPVGGGAPVMSAIANGTWIVALVPQGMGLLVQATAWTSGTATVAANLT